MSDVYRTVSDSYFKWCRWGVDQFWEISLENSTEILGKNSKFRKRLGLKILAPGIEEIVTEIWDKCIQNPTSENRQRCTEKKNQAKDRKKVYSKGMGQINK